MAFDKSITIKLKQFLIIHHFDQFNVNYFESYDYYMIHGFARLLELYEHIHRQKIIKLYI